MASGEREERLREALERIAERTVFPIADPTGRIQNLNHIARAALASSPSPPDRAQAVEKMAMAILTVDDPGLWDALQGDDNILKQQARVEAEAAYAALFGPKHDDNPELIWVTRSSLEAALSPPDREQAVEKVAKELAECGCEESPGLWKDCVDRPGYEMKARAIVAALFGRGDES